MALGSCGYGLIVIDHFIWYRPRRKRRKSKPARFSAQRDWSSILVIIFLAGFFAVNEKFISEYTSFTKRLWFFFFALFAVVATILLFLILGDFGPAMVCCFTFIILFSFSRGDFAPMVASVILYVLTIWFTKNVWLGTGDNHCGCLGLHADCKKTIERKCGNGPGGYKRLYVAR